MKKYIIAFLVALVSLLFSCAVYADEPLPAIYINDIPVDTDDGFVMSGSTVYLRPDVMADVFNVTLISDTGGAVFTFSSQLRVVTYDSSTGSVNITDRNSFLYEVYEHAYPSYILGGEVYIPIRMICTGLYMNIDYYSQDTSVRITTIRDSVGIFNTEGTAIAYRGGKYGLVNTAGDIVLLFSYDAISNYDNPLIFKLTDNHRCGIANSNGKLLTKIEYNEIRYESPTNIYLRKDNKLGLCDINGNITVPVIYDDVAYCGNLIAMVKRGSRWYVRNCQSGELSLHNYDQVYKITTGVQSDNDMIKGYYVQKGEKWGYIDSFGNIVIELKYDALDKFDSYGRARMIYNNRFGVVDCGGRVIIPAAYDYIDTFGTLDVTVAQVGDKYGVINDDFEIVVPFEYSYIYSFNNAHSTVAYQNGKFGIISTGGEHLTDFTYTHMEEFKNGLALAYEDGYGYLDHNGNEVIETVHSDVKQGTALSVFLKKDDRWALYSPAGHNMTGFIYVNAGAFSNGLSAVSVMTEAGERYGYVNDSGDCIIPFIYTAALDFKYGKAIVSQGKYSGIIDISGNMLIPLVYTGFNSSYDYNVIAAANEYSKWGLISFRNEKLCQFEYDYIFEFKDGYAFTIKNHLYGIIDTEGNMLAKPIYKTKEEALTSLNR